LIPQLTDFSTLEFRKQAEQKSLSSEETMKLSFAVVFVVTIALSIADAGESRQNGKRENSEVGRAKFASRLADDSNLKQEIIALIQETNREELDSLREDMEALKNGSDKGFQGCQLGYSDICDDCGKKEHVGLKDEHGNNLHGIGLRTKPFAKNPRVAVSISSVVRYNNTESILGGYEIVRMRSTKQGLNGYVKVTDKSIKKLHGYLFACSTA